jgi:hypothetical protein
MSERRGALICVLAVLTLQACSSARDATPARAARAAVDTSRSLTASAPAPVVAPAPASRGPLTLDTSMAAPVLELWPMSVAPGRQTDEVRRIVEHLQADLAFVPGFERATLLASGDGTSLLLLAEWRDAVSGESARNSVAGWLRAMVDTATRRKLLGTATPRVLVRRTVGTPPTLVDAAMVQFTRFALKPGHSFGALASLADSNLSVRVLQDTSAQGGATLMSADSGAVYMLMQARNATVLDPVLQQGGPLPFWAPFAARTEQLYAVIAVVQRR